MEKSRPSTTKSNQKINVRTIEEELDHQIKKSNLLDADRKSFFYNAEKTKTENLEIINQLKSENKELKKLRDEMLANKRATTPAGMGKTQLTSWGQENKDEQYWVRKFDTSLHETKNLKSNLLNLQDKLNEVTDNKFGGHEESSSMRSIRILENRLDKVMIKFNEAQSIKKTYEQIVKRLKEERVGYDNQLAAIERSLKGKEHDFEELLLLAHDATHAKELAQAELQKYNHKKMAVKELRKTYMTEKWKAVQSRQEVINRIQQQNEQADKQKDKIESPIQTTHQEQQQTQQDTNVYKQKLADYEEAFRKLYEATGVYDVNEIIQKFTTQDETTKSLRDLQQEYEERIEMLRNERSKLKEELNDLKYEGGEQLTRKQIDEIENNVVNATNKCERTKIKFERSSKILVNSKAGIEHLVEKLDFYRLEGKPNIVVQDESLIEALDQCVQKMKIIYQIVKQDPVFKFLLKRKTLSNNQGELPAIYQHPMSNYMTKQQKDAKLEVIKNTRVRLPEKDEDDISDGEIDDDIDIEVTAKLKQKFEMQAKTEKNSKKKKKEIQKK